MGRHPQHGDGITLACTPHAALLPSPAEMAKLDANTISFIGGMEPGLVLMERAGRAAAHFLRRAYRTQLARRGALILCGPGNNGGDGLVIARLLRAWGFLNVQVVLSAADRYSADCLAELARLKPSRHSVRIFPDIARVPAGFLAKHCLKPCSEGELVQMIAHTGLIIDALLGTGQKSAPAGSIAEIISIVQRNRRELQHVCVAVDIPSGVNAASGAVYEPHIEAHATISMELIKRGMLQYPGRACCGDIISVGIGIEPLAAEPLKWRLIVPSNVKIPQRTQPSHKGDFGQVYIVGGSASMPGAALLAARAAARAGAGLVTTVRFSAQPAGQIASEVLQHVIGEKFSVGCVREILEKMRSVSCTVVGPGLGLSSESHAFVKKLLEAVSKQSLPCVIDADALTILAEMLRSKQNLDLSSAVLTPHPGEMSRLLGLSTREVQADRYAAAEELFKKTRAVVVLKGASTVVYSRDGGFVNPTGNAGMSSGGSGDVLCGIIAGLIAQKASLLDAAISGVYVHGLAADLMQADSCVPLLAGEIIEHIPSSYREIWRRRCQQG